jgi:hypothetical protein
LGNHGETEQRKVAHDYSADEFTEHCGLIQTLKNFASELCRKKHHRYANED